MSSEVLSEKVKTSLTFQFHLRRFKCRCSEAIVLFVLTDSLPEQIEQNMTEVLFPNQPFDLRSSDYSLANADWFFPTPVRPLLHHPSPPFPSLVKILTAFSSYSLHLNLRPRNAVALRI